MESQSGIASINVISFKKISSSWLSHQDIAPIESCLGTVPTLTPERGF